MSTVALPNRVHLKIIERFSLLVPDPVERLQFLQLCSRAFPGNSPFVPRRRAWWKYKLRVIVLDSLWLVSARAVEGLKLTDAWLLWVYRRRRPLGYLGIAAVCLSLVLVRRTTTAERRAPLAAEARPAPPLEIEKPLSAFPSAGEVWLVEKSGTSELYSNGLRVLNDFLNHTAPRSYPAITAGAGAAPESVEWRHQPVGIVFHTTESGLLPLESVNRSLLEQRGRGLLEYVRRKKLYNFVIDRFGRVYRILPEEEYADHAGHSLWASGGVLYVNLNQSFIAIALEARTASAAAEGSPPADATPAQLYSARLLAQMLRSRFGLPEANCVSHDLVSVNPARMLIGYHTDWAGGFPYEALGLSNKYNVAPPAMAEFGFRYDTAFLEALRGRLWPGIRLAEARIEREAAERGISPERYRRQLQQDYKRRITLLEGAARARPSEQRP